MGFIWSCASLCSHFTCLNFASYDDIITEWGSDNYIPNVSRHTEDFKLFNISMKQQNV